MVEGRYAPRNPDSRCRCDNRGDAGEAEEASRTPDVARPITASSPLGAVCVSGVECMACGRVPAVDSLLREPGWNPLHRATHGRRWLASDRRPDESEVLPGDPSSSDNSSGSDGTGCRLSAIKPVAEKDILLLALPCGNSLGVSVEAWPQALSPQPHSTALARYPTAQPEVCPDGVLPLHRHQHGG